MSPYGTPSIKKIVIFKNGKKPEWEVELEEGTIRLPPNEVTNYQKFCLRCAEQLRVRFLQSDNRRDLIDWANHINEMLVKAEHRE